MEFIHWDKSVKVDIPIMDEQHKEMVDYTNRLYELIESNEKNEIKKILKLLIENLKTHFDTENQLMEDSKLPNFISHKLEHERFYNKMNGIYLNVKTGKQNLTRDNLKSIKVWFFNHMDFKDKKLAHHIKSIN